MLAPRLAVVSLFAASVALSQTVTSASQSPDALTILQKMSQRYADAHSWYFVATQDTIKVTSGATTGARNQQKRVMTAAVSGKMYRYEGRSGPRAALLVSDGTTAWDLRANEKDYTQEPAPPGGFVQTGFGMGRDEDDANYASTLKRGIAETAHRFESATRLPDAVLAQVGAAIPCYVVMADEPQRKDSHKPEAVTEHTFWIDKADWTLRKETVLRGKGGTQTTIVYETAELDSAIPESLFRFTPPRGVERVVKFRNNLTDGMTGRPAPEVRLVSANGRRVPLSSYRGKPVLLVFWATWCAPCVASLPKLADIYSEAGPKGLVLLTVDEDEDAGKASAFVEKHHFTWPNTQDDGTITEAYGNMAIPHAILIDAKGMIVGGDLGEDDGSLQKAIAGLGPQFALLTPPQPNPRQSTASHP